MQLNNLFQSVATSPDTVALRSKIMTAINKGDVSTDEAISNLQKLAGSGQDQAKKLLDQVIAKGNKMIDTSLDISSPSAIIDQYDLEGDGDKLGLLEAFKKKIKRIYQAGVGEYTPSINLLEDLEKVSDEVGLLKAKNKNLIRKLMDLSTSKQGEGGVDSESHKAEIELKNSKIKKIVKEKDNLQKELDEIKEVNEELQDQLSQEQSKLRKKEKEWKKRQKEWLQQKEELQVSLIEVEAYKSKIDDLKNTIKNLTTDKNSLNEELQSVRYNSRLEETSRRDNNGGVEKLLRKKLENSKKDIELLKDKLEEKTQELLEQDVEMHGQINSLNNQLNFLKEQQLRSEKIAPTTPILPSSVTEGSGHAAFVNELARILSDYHEIAMPENPTDIDISEALENLALVHQDKISEMQNEIKCLKHGKSNIGEPGLKAASALAVQEEKEKEIQDLIIRLRILEAENQMQKDLIAKKNLDNSFNTQALSDIKKSPIILGNDDSRQFQMIRQNEEKIAREKFMMEIELNNTQTRLKNALARIQLIEVENSETAQANSSAKNQISHLRYALDRAHDELKTLKQTMSRTNI